jgi:hypothetical protein
VHFWTKFFSFLVQVAEIYTPKESPWKINIFYRGILFDLIVRSGSQFEKKIFFLFQIFFIW